MDCCPDQKAQKRLNCMHLLLCGVDFHHVRRHARVSERTLQLWISNYNRQGIDGITYRPRSGRPRNIEKQEVRERILPLVEDPSKAGESHWTVVKLCGYLCSKEDFQVSYSTLLRYLHEQDYARRIPRPMPEPPDRDQWGKQRRAFLEEMGTLSRDPKACIFFGDEAGFEGDPRPRQRWVKRGSRPTQGYYGGHIRANVVGAINPQDGQLVSLVVSHNDTAVFQSFLDTMAQEVPENGRSIHLVLDNASWHRSKSLNWHHIKPMFLPAYSPDFNPIERLWQEMKSRHLAGFITNNSEALWDKLCSTICKLIDKPSSLQSVCRNHLK